jgi:3-dehydroquinate dehydratase type I
MRFCLPIIASRTLEVEQLLLQELQTANNPGGRFQLAEIWLDLLAEEFSLNVNDNTVDLEPLYQWLAGQIKLFPNQLILLLRRPNLAATKLNSPERLELLKRLIQQPVLIDLDLHDQKLELEQLGRQLPNQLLLSLHNYRQTPNDSEIEGLIEKISHFNPLILKLAFYCNSAEDAWRLMGWRLKLSNRRAIVLGMGPHGQVTRVVNSIWGNELIFAPTERNTASAPDQLTQPQLATIFGAMGQALVIVK